MGVSLSFIALLSEPQMSRTINDRMQTAANIVFFCQYYYFYVIYSIHCKNKSYGPSLFIHSPSLRLREFAVPVGQVRGQHVDGRPHALVHLVSSSASQASNSPG